MNVRRPLLPILVAASLFACTRLSAQEAAPVIPPSELTLQQCITRALARNFDLEIQRYSPQIARDSIAIARDGFQPVVTATTSASQSHDTTLPLESSSRSVQVGVSQQLYTGTTLSVSSQLNRSRIDPNPALTALNPAYNADRGPISIFAGRLHTEF